MIRKTTLFLIFSFCFVFLASIGRSGVFAASTVRSGEISLGGAWDFTYTHSSSDEPPRIPPPEAFDVKVTVPGRWCEQRQTLEKASWWKSAEFESRLDKSMTYLLGTGWYKRTIEVPEDWQDKAVRLTVGWAVGTIHIWLNSEHVGSYDYGVYTPYAVDLTDRLIPGEENDLVIAVDNDQKDDFAGARFFVVCAGGTAGGVTRPVTLHVADGPGRIADLYTRCGADLEEVVWQAELDVPALSKRAPASKLLWQVFRAGHTGNDKEVLAQGTVVLTPFSKHHRITWKARIPQIQPWSDRHPNLYRTELRWVTDNGATWDRLWQR